MQGRGDLHWQFIQRHHFAKEVTVPVLVEVSSELATNEYVDRNELCSVHWKLTWRVCQSRWLQNRNVSNRGCYRQMLIRSRTCSRWSLLCY